MWRVTTYINFDTVLKYIFHVLVLYLRSFITFTPLHHTANICTFYCTTFLRDAVTYPQWWSFSHLLTSRHNCMTCVSFDTHLIT